MIWRKLDCLNPNLQKMQRPVRRKDTRYRRHALRRPGSAVAATFGGGALPGEGNQGDEWDAYVTLGLRQGRTRDQSSGRSPPGDGVLVVVVGVATHQGGRESRPQGEGAQVAGHRRAARYA